MDREKDKVKFVDLILFGSHAKSKAVLESDIDICIVIDCGTDAEFEKQRRAATFAANQTKENLDIIVVTKKDFFTNRLSPNLHEIKKSGKSMMRNR